MSVQDAQVVLDMDAVGESFYRYEPRPDDHELFDQQTSFLNDKLMGTAWLLGGNGAGTTETAMRKLARFVILARIERMSPETSDQKFAQLLRQKQQLPNVIPLPTEEEAE